MQINTSTSLTLPQEVPLTQLRAMLDSFEASAGTGATCTARVRGNRLILVGHSDNGGGSTVVPGAEILEEPPEA